MTQSLPNPRDPTPKNHPSMITFSQNWKNSPTKNEGQTNTNSEVAHIIKTPEKVYEMLLRNTTIQPQGKSKSRNTSTAMDTNTPPHKQNTQPKKEVALEPKRAARPLTPLSDTNCPIKLGLKLDSNEIPDYLNAPSTSKMSTCVPHTPADEPKGKNVTEKEKNMSLNKNPEIEYNIVTKNDPITYLYPPTANSANTTHEDYYFLHKLTNETN